MWSLMSSQGARPAMQMLVASKSYCIHPLFSILKKKNTDGGSRWVIYRATGPTRSYLPVSTEAPSVEFILGDRRSLPTLAQGPCFAGVGKLEVFAMVAGLGLLERISRIRDLWHGYAMFCLYGLPGVTQITQILHGWWFRRSKRVPLYSDVSICDISIYFKTKKMYI